MPFIKDVINQGEGEDVLAEDDFTYYLVKVMTKGEMVQNFKKMMTARKKVSYFAVVL